LLDVPITIDCQQKLVWRDKDGFLHRQSVNMNYWFVFLIKYF